MARRASPQDIPLPPDFAPPDASWLLSPFLWPPSPESPPVSSDSPSPGTSLAVLCASLPMASELRGLDRGRSPGSHTVDGRVFKVRNSRPAMVGTLLGRERNRTEQSRSEDRDRETQPERRTPFRPRPPSPGISSVDHLPEPRWLSHATFRGLPVFVSLALLAVWSPNHADVDLQTALW